jgi:rubrerythrin
VAFFNRLFARSTGRVPAVAAAAVQILHGGDTLEVVGESHYQDHLWHLVGGFTTEHVRAPMLALLIPEPSNQHDPNAIKVVIDGGTVGYLSRDDALAYRPGLLQLIDRWHASIALEGQIVGGGQRADGTGMLGVFLDHNPVDFGVHPQVATHIGELRTGLAQAAATDLEDDGYDLSWYDQLSGSRTPADIRTLRQLLETEEDPIDRHYMFAELAACLYKCRDVFMSALEEFDAVCEQHHAEMATIRAALLDKFGCIPVIEMYRQAAIRWQKAHDWSRMRIWTQRGLAVYETQPARPEAVADLDKRLAYATAKLVAPAATTKGATARADTGARHQRDLLEVETFTCRSCGRSFERPRARGRKPHRCPSCRRAAEPVTTP